MVESLQSSENHDSIWSHSDSALQLFFVWSRLIPWSRVDRDEGREPSDFEFYFALVVKVKLRNKIVSWRVTLTTYRYHRLASIHNCYLNFYPWIPKPDFWVILFYFIFNLSKSSKWVKLAWKLENSKKTSLASIKLHLRLCSP